MGILKVKLLTYTPEPERVCVLAMRGCRYRLPAYEIKLNKPVEYYIKLAKKSGHLSVLEHAVFTFSVKQISRACTHQLVRHRIASYSQQSGRIIRPEYIIMPESIYNSDYALEFIRYSDELLDFFNKMCDNGIPMDDARYILPFGHESNIVITMNARELLHFLELRLGEHAHWEIKLMANLMLEELKKVAPTIFEGM